MSASRTFSLASELSESMADIPEIEMYLLPTARCAHSAWFICQKPGLVSANAAWCGIAVASGWSPVQKRTCRHFGRSGRKPAGALARGISRLTSGYLFGPPIGILAK